MKLELTRLTIPRQRRLVSEWRALREDKTFTKSLKPEVREVFVEAVSLGERIDTAVTVSPLVIDATTDSVITAFDTVLESFERIANDRVVRPSPEVLKKKAAALTLRQLAFPGTVTAVTEQSMPLQHKSMSDLVTLLQRDKQCHACVDELGLGWVVAQLVAHLEPYGRAVRNSDGRDVQADSVAFHEAMTLVAIRAAAHEGVDTQRRLFGAYDTELEAQQQDEREGRKRAAKRKAEGTA